MVEGRHDEKGEPWTVEALAREVGMLRNVFAERFTRLIGISPMHYLARWRLQVVKIESTEACHR